MAGRLIALEGIDAAGKATHAKTLTARLMRAHTVTFPSYRITACGPVILDKLTEKWWIDTNDTNIDINCTEALVLQALMVVDKLEWAADIRKFLLEGFDVVLDRYWGSAIAYGQADGLEEGFLRKIHALLPQPDVWVLLDIPPEESIRRRPERRDVYEKRAGLMETVRKNYLRLFKEGGPKWRTIDATGPVALVQERLWRAIATDYTAGDKA